MFALPTFFSRAGMLGIYGTETEGAGKNLSKVAGADLGAGFGGSGPPHKKERLSFYPYTNLKSEQYKGNSKHKRERTVQ